MHYAESHLKWFANIIFAVKQVKGLDDESEATLLTALTEILDNVDDETLSPFDMLPGPLT